MSALSFGIRLESTREFFRRDQVWPFPGAKEQAAVNVGNQMILYVEDLNWAFDGFQSPWIIWTCNINDGELRCFDWRPMRQVKTTLMDVITAITQCDSVRFSFRQKITIYWKKTRSRNCATLAIGRKFQKNQPCWKSKTVVRTIWNCHWKPTSEY